MTHHPHVHMIVPGGGLSADGQRWIAVTAATIFLPVRVLSRLFRRLVFEKLIAAHGKGQAALFREPAELAGGQAFAAVPHTAASRRSGSSTPRSPFAGSS